MHDLELLLTQEKAHTPAEQQRAEAMLELVLYGPTRRKPQQGDIQNRCMAEGEVPVSG